MPLVLGSNSASAGGYNVDNSLRFNSGSSDYLNRTPATTTNQRTWTYSFWIKRTVLGTTQYFLYARNDDNNRSYFRFNSTDTLGFFATSSASVKLEGTITSRVFRDVSAWYHIVLSADTTQATSANRFRVYVNGTEQTLTFDTTPSQNSDLSMNISHPTAIGVYVDGLSGYLNGYMSEIYMIDGQQLTPSSFGETDTDTNIWKPIPYTGSFGTNGFYLEFQNSASLGTDSSGNGNNFTVNNLTSVDQSTDTCTNNFATLNPLNYTPSAITYTEGNLKTSYPGSWNAAISTIGVSTGKWYWEAKAVTGGNNIFYGIMTENATTNSSTPYSQIGVLCGKTTDGDKYLDTTYTAGGFGTSANGDILGFALDLSSGTKNLTITKNGASLTGGSVNLSSNFNNVNIFAFFAGNSSSASAGWEANFGNPLYSANSYADAEGFGNFSYAVPAGYFALCSKNLAEYA